MSILFTNLLQIRELHRLKSTYRRAKVNNRQESVAEHTYGCLVIANYLFETMKLNLDKSKVYELLLYHDIGEINIGDIPIAKISDTNAREREEHKNIIKFAKDFPVAFRKKVVKSHKEFEAHQSKEAKFAKCIDAIEALFFGIENDPKIYWKGWNTEVINKHYKKRFDEFIELRPFFQSIIEWLIENKYLQN